MTYYFLKYTKGHGSYKLFTVLDSAASHDTIEMEKIHNLGKFCNILKNNTIASVLDPFPTIYHMHFISST
jgi:hypothetical protein